MECKKCSIEIPSQFEFVLSQNVCPKCGNKLMADAAMKVYVDLKKRLNEVEFVMDKAVVCERVALFLVTNYNVSSFDSAPAQASHVIDKAKEAALIKAQMAALDGEEDLSAEEIRAEEAARAEELALAREYGLGSDLDSDEELVTGAIDSDRIQRLKKLAVSGQVGLIKRSS